MPLSIVIIGRPNVGKSTLFNRLVGKKLALVDDRPGVTRDRREGEGRIADLEFRVIDTAGLEDEAPETLAGRMRAQTERALDEADLALLLFDARAGLTETDRHFARWLHKSGKPVVLVANKAETSAALADLDDAYRMGFGEPVPISAQHGEGFAELYERLAPLVAEGEPPAEDESPKPLQLAIIGRPNVGKSTLVNRLLGEDRLLTGPEPGITRDSIAVEWRWRDRDFRLVDTAGMRRRARIEEPLERLAVADALRTVRYAETVIVVLDSLQPFERQDLTIANLAAEEGRAIVVAANKWDAVPDKGVALNRLRDRMTASLPQLDGVPLVPVSGLTGFGLDALMAAACEADTVWNKRVPTPVLNRWLAAIQEHHPPPVAAGRRLKLRYITQVNTRPPTFALFSSRPGELPESYRRYLVNSLRKDFDLPGTPIRMMLRKGQNPYART